MSPSASRSVSRAVSFINARGERLVGRLDLPVDGAPRACALFAHCFTCGKSLRGAVELTRALTREGFAVLRFDFTGLGESEGDFSGTTFSSTADDLVAASEYMARELEAPTLLLGHSLGGTAVLAAAERIPSARALVTIGAPFDAAHVVQHFGADLATIEREGVADVSIAGRAFRMRREFVDDVREQRMADRISALRRPLLVLHAPGDGVVGIENAARIYTAARHPKSFVSLDGADHLLSEAEDATYAALVVAAWSSRYLPAVPVPTEPELVAAGGGVFTRTGSTGFRTEIRSGAHALTADEPLAVGGTDAGPSPYELLLAALGACTGMTLRMYAERKGWPLDAVSVELHHRRVHAHDEGAVDTDAARLDRVERVIGLTGPLDDAQRRRLLEIADRCPVHRSLDRGVSVETRVVAPPQDLSPPEVTG